MTALLTNEYRPCSLAVIGFAGGVACACDFSCPSRAQGTAISAANAKQSLLFTRYLPGNHATSRSGKVGNRAPGGGLTYLCEIGFSFWFPTRAGQHRSVISRENGHSVPGTLSLHCFVSELLTIRLSGIGFRSVAGSNLILCPAESVVISC